MPISRDTPLVTLKWSQTLDGQLADDRDQSQWISGPEERNYTHQLRAQHQAIAVGAQTFLKDRSQLTVRNVLLSDPQPARVIFDPRGRIIEALKKNELNLELLQGGPRKTYLLTDVIDSDSIVQAGSNLICLSYRFESFKFWLEEMLFQLARRYEVEEERGLKKLMVEGGATLLAEFLKGGLTDYVEVSISPLILGGHRHRVRTESYLQNADRFEMDSQQQLGSDVVLRYKTKSERNL